MKDRTAGIRFLMITGVSRFTKMSMFSALSNLTNLSMDDQYATMLGYTEEELDKYFGD
ncbi:MAG: AAA family ATPase, partial [Selenomonadaceae bacterium]|nr:AAA family ATPase [Selenomonadaceae bacterium]